MKNLGNRNLLDKKISNIDVPVTFLLGEKDDMVTREETEFIQLQLQHSTFHLLPNTLHAIEQVDAIVLLPYFLNN